MITPDMPISGCACSSARMTQKIAKAISMQGKRGDRLPSLISQAVVTAKQGLRNSDGCTDMSGKAIQRRAPLISMPTTRVEAVSSSAIRQPTIARRRMLRGDISDTPTTMPPATARKHTCLMMNMSRGVPMRCATAGEAASIMT
jgi:hypothetical protein